MITICIGVESAASYVMSGHEVTLSSLLRGGRLPPVSQGLFSQYGIHHAPGIVNDAVCDFMSILVGFQLFKSEFNDDLFVCRQLNPLDQADKQFPVCGGRFQETLHQFLG